DDRRWIDPELRRIIHDPWVDTTAKLKASLALLPVDSAQAMYLDTRLSDTATHDLLVLVDFLRRHEPAWTLERPRVTDRLLAILKDQHIEKAEHAAAASLFVDYAHNHPVTLAESLLETDNNIFLLLIPSIEKLAGRVVPILQTELE